MNNEDLERILLTPQLSTASQRRALYRMGRSRSWVKKYAATKEAADAAIRRALDEHAAISGTGEDVRPEPARDVDAVIRDALDGLQASPEERAWVIGADVPPAPADAPQATPDAPAATVKT